MRQRGLPTTPIILCIVVSVSDVEVISHWTFQSRYPFKKCIHVKNRRCVDVGRTTTFCMITTRFMSHNLVVQSCMTKLLSVWTHLQECFKKVLGMFQKGSRNASKRLQECFKKVLGMFQKQFYSYFSRGTSIAAPLPATFPSRDHYPTLVTSDPSLDCLLSTPLSICKLHKK